MQSEDELRPYIAVVADRLRLDASRARKLDVSAISVSSLGVVSFDDVIVKVIRKPSDDQTGSAPEHHNYWAREALLVASRMSLPAGPEFRAPKYLGAGVVDDTWGYIATERIQGRTSGCLTLEDLSSIARGVGVANAGYLHAGVPESARRHNPHYLRAIVESRRAATPWIADPQAWRNAGMPVLSDAVLEVHRSAEVLLAALARSPLTLAHHDVNSENSFILSERGVVVIDWALAGPAALGEDIHALVLEPLLLRGDERATRARETIVFPAYLDGLRQGGWNGDEDHIRFALYAHAALHWLFGIGFVLRHASTEATRQRYASRMGRPFEQLVREACTRVEVLLSMAETARRMIASP